MLELQQEYRAYADAIKKKIDKDKSLEELGDSDADENGECSLTSATFPEGVRVFSSDEDERAFLEAFEPVNRRPEYLKQSTLAYLKEQKLESLARRISVHEWQQYSDQVLTQDRAQGIEKRRKPAKWRKHRVRSWRSGSLVPIQTQGILAWPIDRTQFWLSSFYGPRKKPNGSWGFHYGLDMAAVRGTLVHAAADGVVVEARHSAGYGNTVVIAHNALYKTRYAHLHSINVKEGKHVQQGDRIGTVGATGLTRKRGRDASHLHFETFERGKHVNPLYLLVA